MKYGSNLRGLVVSNMVAGIAEYERYIASLRAQLPVEVQETLSEYEERQAYSDEKYEALLMQHLYSKHICQSDPWPQPVLRCFSRPNLQV